MVTLAKVPTGFKSSELYLTLLTSGLGVAVMLGWITPEQAKTLTQAGKDFFDGATIISGAFLTIVPILAYFISRTKLKAEAIKATALTTQLLGSLPVAKTITPSSAAQQTSAKPSYIVA